MQVSCSSCGAILQVPPHLLQQPVRCGQCGLVVIATPALMPMSVATRAQSSEVPGGSVASLVLGIIGLVAWCLPILGLPINLIGLILGLANVRRSEGRGLAIAGIVMSTLGLALSVVNAILGVLIAIAEIE